MKAETSLKLKRELEKLAKSDNQAVQKMLKALDLQHPGLELRRES